MGLRWRRRGVVLAAGALSVVVGLWLWLAYRTGVGGSLPPGDYEPRYPEDWEVSETAAREVREDALARAQVWRPPPTTIDRADLTRNPGDRDPLVATDAEPMVCKFLPSAGRGTTPKFDCVLPGGDVIKVKYGATPEIPSEVAASRLLSALGFGADRMYVLPRVRCFGCPASPFRTYQVLDFARARQAFTRRLDYGTARDFEWVAVERRFPAATISTGEVKGWAFHELAKIDPARGGASRAQVDALRLMAAFLHHWDNKSENQRLVCLARPEEEDNGPCPEPLAFIQDLGAAFGPTKVSLDKWSGRAVFSSEATCEVSMKDMPFEGATFGVARISEGGRRFLADRIGQLSEEQIRSLFTAARFGEHQRATADGADVGKWVEAFQDKVRQIAQRPPCPP